MYTILKYLNFSVATVAIVLSVTVPIVDFSQHGSFLCSDIISIAVLVGGFVLFLATYLIDRSSLGRKYLYFLATLLLSYFIVVSTHGVVLFLLGLTGRMECSLFVG
ncbi:hypothetical protein A3C18_02190 [Candidatus Kaiserbacteria bacterium RIFCSPHIGHO2_02_FULL_54_11b]|uniref:Uncharacterized protein n=1 Tax=Candidatus Kaiserbacteria bacterium RIFCSPHIGHO2_02_FULL_54_11b TaxID=1798494 RepID=A0A1F6DQW5_9BACT|nr:MAG: hypothetical protein A3C18_02190 [Candidatus Kaiserbacteria bacterium RIFCSPHIGHO2_02_FULL_54_11b]